MTATFPIERDEVERLLTLPRVETFKRDRRSEVWHVSVAGCGWVIKTMPCSTPWQRLMWLFGNHAIRREHRSAGRLCKLGIAVVDHAFVGRIGPQAVLVTPYAGLSLFHVLRQAACSLGQRREIAHQLGDMLHVFRQNGITFKDMKTSNILITMDDDGRPTAQLIDVESARRAIVDRHRRTLRMFALLDETAAQHRPSRTDRWRVARQALADLTGRQSRRHWLTAIQSMRHQRRQEADATG